MAEILLSVFHFLHLLLYSIVLYVAAVLLFLFHSLYFSNFVLIFSTAVTYTYLYTTKLYYQISDVLYYQILIQK